MEKKEPETEGLEPETEGLEHKTETLELLKIAFGTEEKESGMEKKE